MSTVHTLVGQKVLVTGARGFLGSHLRRRLLSLGAEVYGLSRVPVRDSNEPVRWRQGSFADLGTAESLLREVKPDTIFHLAGRVTAAPDLTHVLPTLQSLLVSTVNLLSVATQVGCRRIVLTGSLTEPLPGQSDSAPGSPYAAAKLAANAYARMFKELYKTPIVIVRPFMAYGPGQDVHKLVPYVTLSLLRGQAPYLSSGQWQADWVYVDDVTEGFVTAAHMSGIEGCTIDLGTGVLTSVQDLVGQVMALLGSSVQPVFGARADRPNENLRVADVAFAFSKLGWQPCTPLTEGLKRTVEWYGRELKLHPEIAESV